MRNLMNFGWVLFLLAGGVVPAVAAEILIPDRPNSIALIAQDMAAPHEAMLHGVPIFFDWYEGPRINMGLKPGEFTAVNAWGQVYEAAEGNVAVNTRVQLRNIAIYYLSLIDGSWHTLQRTNSVEGEAYAEDFADNQNTTAEIRQESSGGISIVLTKGMNFHFWPEGDRVLLPATSDMLGIFATVQARLILVDPDAKDDRDGARYLVGMGADYWRSVDAQWVENYGNNNDIGIGRHRLVTSQWQSFNMTTLTLEELQNTPPPLR